MSLEALIPAGVAERSLSECERIIERGLVTFVEVGQALMEIRDGRLYRESHGTFEDYCRERWGFSPQHGGRLIAAAEAVVALEPNGSTPPSESVARELTPLRDEPEVLRAAWTEAVERHGPTPTAAQVRDVVEPKRGMAVHYSSATDEWATPRPLFDALNDEFRFTLDVCALDTSAKCERYFTPETDGLAQDWTGTCWMNPPYGSEIVKWIEKAASSATKPGTTVVCLVPARTDTRWWWDHCRHAEVRLIRGRLKFGEADTGAPFPSAVVVFGRPARTVYWDPKEVALHADAA